MITLITYPAMGQSFSLSPFCCKAALMLDYAGLEWQREDTHDPRRMPYGKLPAIRTETGQVIGDSDSIRLYLEQLGTDFYPGFSEAQQAHGRALIRMAEEHMYFHIVLDRWGDPTVWNVIRARYFEAIPFPVRNLIANGLRRKLLNGMNAQGLGRLSPQERSARVEQDLKAVADLLWQGPFLLGNTVSLADFSMAPMLQAMRQTPVETPLALRVAGDPILVEYIDRVESAARPSNVERQTA